MRSSGVMDQVIPLVLMVGIVAVLVWGLIRVMRRDRKKRARSGSGAADTGDPMMLGGFVHGSRGHSRETAAPAADGGTDASGGGGGRDGGGAPEG